MMRPSMKFVYIVLCCLLLSVSVLAQAPQKAQIAFSTNRDGNYEIYVMDVDGSNQRNLTNNAARDVSPAWSPDGKKIAFCSNRDGNWEIYAMDADGKNPCNITNSPTWDESPSWSPDGKKIAFYSIVFTSSLEADSGIYIMDTDGRNQRNLINAPYLICSSPSWSPDGQKIAFSWYGGGIGSGIAITAIDANSKNWRYIVETGGMAATYDSPAWSPDGKMIAFVRWWDGAEPFIFVKDADGKNEIFEYGTTLTEGMSPAWSPDGQSIAFTSWNYEIYVVDADGKNQTKLTNNPANDFSPDWFDPAYVITAVSPAGKLVTTWAKIKQNGE